MTLQTLCHSLNFLYYYIPLNIFSFLKPFLCLKGSLFVFVSILYFIINFLV